MPLSATAASLAEVLDEMTCEGAPELTEHLPGAALKCYACGHRCLIKEGKRGICKVRFNEGGHLRVPVNYVAALQCDPTEKKPFFHALPGSDTLTFGMLGCDLHCAYCQNWLTSQALRDDAAVSPPNIVTAERLVAMAKAYGASMVGSSYNENGRSKFSRKRGPKAFAQLLSRTATRRRRYLIICDPGPIVTRSI